MSDADLVGRVEFTAERVLLGDRAKLATFGGQRFAEVERVTATHDPEIDVLFVVATAKDGRRGRGPVMPHLVHKSEHHGTLPGDLHEAVIAALAAAQENLAAA
jgi:hypothetical protein